MPLIPIEAIEDPRVLPYRDLPRSCLPKQAGLFIVEGRLLVELLLSSDFAVESVLVDDDRLGSIADLVSEDVPVYVTRRGLVEQIVGYSFHRGILGCGRLKPLNSIADIGGQLSQQCTVVVGIEVHDPENLGAIIRNCAAFHVDAVVLSPRCCDPFSRRVLRVSMGNVLRIPIIESTCLETDLAQLRQLGFRLTATVLDEDAEQIRTLSSVPRQAILLGNEAHGLDRSWIERCDHRVTIPIRGDVDSLNVAVASGICLYYISAQQ